MATGQAGTGPALQGGDPAEAPVVLFMASAGDHLSGRKWHIVGSAGGAGWGRGEGQSWNTPAAQSVGDK